MKNKNLWKRIIFTFMILLIYKIICQVTLPMINQDAITQGMSTGDFTQLIAMVGGAGLENFSIFATGVTPYITASLIIQLLSDDVVPYLNNLRKDGYRGREKLNRYTKYLGLLFAIVQSVSLIYKYNNENSDLFIGEFTMAKVIMAVFLMVAGYSLLTWMGNRISIKGIGNGMSMIITAGIAGALPAQISGAWSAFDNEYWKFGIYAGVLLVIIACITLLQISERRIPVQYTYSDIEISQINNKYNYLPIKANSAGVIPVIYASAFLQAPVMIMSFFPDAEWFDAVKPFIDFSTWYSLVLYAVLVWSLTYFCTYTTIVRVDETADSLEKSGAYIIGIRPGKETKQFLGDTLGRITVLGALILTLLAVTPYAVPLIWEEMPASISLSGTGLLILVGVAVETVNQMKGMITQNSYKTYYKRVGLEDA